MRRARPQLHSGDVGALRYLRRAEARIQKTSPLLRIAAGAALTYGVASDFWADGAVVTVAAAIVFAGVSASALGWRHDFVRLLSRPGLGAAFFALGIFVGLVGFSAASTPACALLGAAAGLVAFAWGRLTA